MKKFNAYFILLVVLLTSTTLIAQDSKKNTFQSHIIEANLLYDKKDYKGSAKAYAQAFKIDKNRANKKNQYNAACSYALAGNKRKAFKYLFKATENQKDSYKDIAHIQKDGDLKTLHKKRKWSKLIAKIQANKEEYEKDFDKPLVVELEQIYTDDQKYRKLYSGIITKHGRDSKELKALWLKIGLMDSLNLIKIKNILDTRAWLGPKTIGKKGNATLFLVIQHSDLDTQLEYLPMMKAAVAKGNARPDDLALLIDRTNLGQGKAQIYGSQVGFDKTDNSKYVRELIEPEKVNERRASVGLMPIENYVKYMNLTWDIERHKAKIKELKTRKALEKKEAKN